MDDFGIGAAILGAARIYLHGARQTGRTGFMINNLKDGDRIWFSDIHHREAKRVEKACFERGINVECMTISPKYAERILSYAPAQGRTFFDHSWLEEYYLIAIERAIANIPTLQNKTLAADPLNPVIGPGYNPSTELTKWRVV